MDPTDEGTLLVKLKICDADDADMMQRLTDDLDHFWRDVLPLMDSSMESSSLHNIARLSCFVDSAVKQQPSATADSAVESKVLNIFTSAEGRRLCFTCVCMFVCLNNCLSVHYQSIKSSICKAPLKKVLRGASYE